MDAAFYILYSAKLDKYYSGSCVNLKSRFRDHNAGNSTYTSSGTPWELKYYEFYPSLQDARKREREVKRMKSRKYIEALIANFKPDETLLM